MSDYSWMNDIKVSIDDELELKKKKKYGTKKTGLEEMNNNDLIKKLKITAKAYDNALENDYCTDEFPDFEGESSSEIINGVMALIEDLEVSE